MDSPSETLSKSFHSTKRFFLLIRRTAERAEPPAHHSADGRHPKFRSVLVCAAVEQRRKHFNFAFPVHGLDECEFQSGEYLLARIGLFATGKGLPVRVASLVLTPLWFGDDRIKSPFQFSVVGQHQQFW